MKTFNNKKLSELMTDEKITSRVSKFIILLAFASVLEFVGIAAMYLLVFEFWKAITFSLISQGLLRWFNLDVFYVIWNFKYRNEPELLKVWEDD